VSENVTARIEGGALGNGGDPEGGGEFAERAFIGVRNGAEGPDFGREEGRDQFDLAVAKAGLREGQEVAIRFAAKDLIGRVAGDDVGNPARGEGLGEQELGDRVEVVNGSPGDGEEPRQSRVETGDFDGMNRDVKLAGEGEGLFPFAVALDAGDERVTGHLAAEAAKQES
jgi:hypothetical protein